MTIRKIERVLVANRGEIAIRVLRAATELGFRTIAIYSEEDRLSLHRYKADESYLVGKGKGPLRAYLGIEEIIALAKEKNVDAIHPGYGFLSENADFARACERAGILFIGPPARQIARMGDKVEGRKLARRHGLHLIPGSRGAVSLKGALDFASREGYPVILKAAFGGGGRGMRVAHSARELKKYYEEARRESETAFGRSEIFVERYIERPKHIEVQLMGDHYGNVVHCWDRDCSIQRRHQKVIEIAPTPLFLDGEAGIRMREKICEAAASFGRALGYRNAGTVEFLYDVEAERYYFMEMNTRIQVEHTVTEMVTGLDLVKTQFLVAQGYPLHDSCVGIPYQAAVRSSGVAIQCRITTEDPGNDFMPDYGRLSVYRSPAGHGIRLDAGSAHTGAVITPYYDSLLVKVTSFGRDLREAARRMDRALAEFRVRGVKTNILFLRRVMQDGDFLAKDFRTDYLETHPHLVEAPPAKDRASKLLQYIGEITVNGNPILARREKKRPEVIVEPAGLDPKDGNRVPEGTRDKFRRLGPEKFIEWIKRQRRLLVTDTTFRDAHQSLLATRVRTNDMVRVARYQAERLPEIFSYEMWGGATFDAAMRFLKEDPWERLDALRCRIPNTLFQMLLRGSNAVGYTNYPDNVIKEFVRLAVEGGIDLFRIFDSLNWLPPLRMAIEAVREAGGLAEAAICYTGNIEDPSRKKYNLAYYVKLAKELERAGAQILAIKDMAGLLRPFSARLLVKTLKNEIGIPIHLHTHDTAGIQAATLLVSAEAGVDIVDAALAAMSGLTSQVNLNSLVAALEFHRRSTGLDRTALDELAAYWESVRRNYAPFEPDLRAGTATVYEHEMPGGQYTNLRAQAEAMNLGHRWKEVVEAYRAANRLFGDIVKVTPSSKVVGDLALFMVTNGITEENFFEKAPSLSFPESVIGMLRGELGRPPGGFPPRLRKVILRGEEPIRGRPGSVLPPADFEKTRAELNRKERRRGGEPVSDRDVVSHLLYPQVAEEFREHRREFGNTSVLPTTVFLYGLKPGQEISFDIEEGKTLFIKLMAVSEPDEEGYRTLFFELNGHPRDVRVFDRSRGEPKKERPKADPDNLHQLGSPLPGRVIQVKAEAGAKVAKGETLFVLEAMKMETSVAAPRDGQIHEVLVAVGDTVDAGDLILTFE
ncbi:MAG: pyruvate carboxylase [Candidatus Hydrogenedentota bacterium]|nr:MAG: pyruvate carboxylase [Candidatus Hydrogenedentota bacterium]